MSRGFSLQLESEPPALARPAPRRAEPGPPTPGSSAEPRSRRAQAPPPQGPRSESTGLPGGPSRGLGHRVIGTVPEGLAHLAVLERDRNKWPHNKMLRLGSQEP